jgi:membrane protease YdiL (CAAX protease family)
MTAFQHTALFLTAIWLLIVAVRFRRSTIVLIGGLFTVGLYTAIALARGLVSREALGLAIPDSWIPTIELVAVWLVLMLVYSPAADWLASRWFPKAPTLQTFRAIQESTTKLILGIIVAWLLGGVLEELVFRGIVLRSVESLMAMLVAMPIAASVAAIVAALGAGLIHFYQGPRAMMIVTQLSVLFGVLFIVSGYNLWAVILCHGLYDTIAFIRFARKKSKYSDLDSAEPRVA